MYRYLLFSLLIIFLPPASATDLYESLSPKPLNSSFGLDYNIGLENSKNYHANLDLAVANDRYLQLGIGKSDVLTQTDRVNLYNLTVGYHSRYGAPFEYGLVYDYWGNTNDLWTNTLSIPLRWNSRNWSVSLQPQFMRIYLYSQRFNRPQRLHRSNSRALSSAIDYYGFEHWELGISGATYHYEATLSRLNNPLASFLFNDVTLLLSYGFPRSRLAGSIAYNFDNWRLGIKQEQTVSEIDASKLDVTSVNTTFYLSKRFSLMMEAGYISTKNSVPYNYFNLGTQIFF